MTNDLVLNDLSMLPAFVDVSTARTAMEDFCSLIKECRNYKVGKILRVSSDFWTYQITSDYSVSEWLNDPTVSRDRRIYLKSLGVKWPRSSSKCNV